MLYRLGIAGFYLVAILTDHFRGGHGAVPVLLDNSRCGAFVTDHTFIVTTGQHIDPCPFTALAVSPGAPADGHGDENKAPNNDHAHQPGDQQTPCVQGAVRGFVVLIYFFS